MASGDVVSSLPHTHTHTDCECDDCARRANERSSGTITRNRTDKIITIVTLPLAAHHGPVAPSTVIILTEYNDRLNCSAILIIIKRNESHSPHIRASVQNALRVPVAVVFHFYIFNFFFFLFFISISTFFVIGCECLCVAKMGVLEKCGYLCFFFFCSCVSNIYFTLEKIERNPQNRKENT